MTHDEKETTFRQYMPLIQSEAWRQVRRFGGCRDEFVQEASLAVWVAIDKFDETNGASMLTFLMSCIRWRFLTLHRKSKTRSNRSALPLTDVIDHRRDDSTAGFEELISLARQHDQDLLVRIYRDGYTQAEIGEQLGVSHQRVQQRAKKSLEMIQGRLQRQGVSPEMRRELRGK